MSLKPTQKVLHFGDVYFVFLVWDATEVSICDELQMKTVKLLFLVKPRDSVNFLV